MIARGRRLRRAGELLPVHAVSEDGVLIRSDGALVRYLLVEPPNPLVMDPTGCERMTRGLTDLLLRVRAGGSVQVHVQATPVHSDVLAERVQRETDQIQDRLRHSGHTGQAQALSQMAALHHQALMEHARTQAAIEITFLLVVPVRPSLTPNTVDGLMLRAPDEHARLNHESVVQTEQIQSALSAIDTPARPLTGPQVLDALWARMSPADARERPELAPSKVGGALPALTQPLRAGQARLHAHQLQSLVCTGAVDLTQPHRVRLGTDLHHTIYASRVPERTFYGWMLHAMQNPRPWTLSVHAHMLDRHQMRRSYRAKERRLDGLNTGRRMGGHRPDRDQERQEEEYGILVDQDLATGAESLCDLSIYQTFSEPGPDPDPDALAADLTGASRDLGTVVDAGISRAAVMQPALWRSTLPLALDHTRRTFRLVTRNAADSLPLCSTRCGSTSGLLLGFADPGRTVEQLNPHDRAHDNPLTVVFSKSGGGKTATVINLLTQALPRGAQATVIDRSTGHYEFATQLIPGAAHLQPAADADDGGVSLNPWDTPDTGQVPRSKVAFLTRLHALLAGEHDLASDSYGLTPLERNLLAQAIRETYAVAHRTSALPRESLLRTTLHALAEEPDADQDAASVYRSLAHRLSEFCADGTYGHLLDVPSTISDEDPPLLVFNTTKVPEDLSAAVVFIALEHTLRRVEDRHARRQARLAAGELAAGPFDGTSIVVLEEMWRLLARPATRDWVTEQARRGRHLGLWLIGISQQRSDLAGPAGKALLDNATITLLLKQGREEAEYIASALQLSTEEQEQITRLQTSKGRYAQAYLINGAVGRGQVEIPANPHTYWITTSEPQHDVPRRTAALHHAGLPDAETDAQIAHAAWAALDQLAAEHHDT